MRNISIMIAGVRQNATAYTKKDAEKVLAEQYPDAGFRISSDLFLSYPVWRVHLYRTKECLEKGCGPINEHLTIYRQVGL